MADPKPSLADKLRALTEAAKAKTDAAKKKLDETAATQASAPITPPADTEDKLRAIIQNTLGKTKPAANQAPDVSAEQIAAQMRSIMGGMARGSVPIVEEAQPLPAGSKAHALVNGNLGKEMMAEHKKFLDSRPKTLEIMRRSADAFSVLEQERTRLGLESTTAEQTNASEQVALVLYYAKAKGRPVGEDIQLAVAEISSSPTKPLFPLSQQQPQTVRTANSRTPKFDALEGKKDPTTGLDLQAAINWHLCNVYNKAHTLGNSYTALNADTFDPTLVMKVHGIDKKTLEDKVKKQLVEDKLDWETYKKNGGNEQVFGYLQSIFSTQRVINKLETNKAAYDAWRHSELERLSGDPERLRIIARDYARDIEIEQQYRDGPKPTRTFESVRTAFVPLLHEEFYDKGNRSVINAATSFLPSYTQEGRTMASIHKLLKRSGCAHLEGDYTAEPNPTALCTSTHRAGNKTAAKS